MGMFMIMWRIYFSSKVITSTALACILISVLMYLYRTDLFKLFRLIKQEVKK